MTTFLRLVASRDKPEHLREACAAFREHAPNDNVFEVAPESFSAVPGSPFAYWVSQSVRDYFKAGIPFEGEGRYASVGASTKDNFRYTRLWTEVSGCSIAGSRGETKSKRWVPFAMGGRFSPYYRDLNLVLNWLDDGNELKAALSEYRGSRGWGYQWSAALNGHDYYFNAGLTWPLRASRFAPQAMPAGCIFSGRGYAAFVPSANLLETLSIFNSSAFDFIFKVALGRFGHPEFLVGILHYIPFIKPQMGLATKLRRLAQQAWSIKRAPDTMDETSHAFMVPFALHDRVGGHSDTITGVEFSQTQIEIDNAVFDLYGLSETDRAAAEGSLATVGGDTTEEREAGDDDEDVDDDDEIDDDENHFSSNDESYGLLSWSIGVAFGRFDWRLATGERVAPPEPEPFDPLPPKSPGMLLDGEAAFHTCSGVLVDEPGHPHDLVGLIEEVLVRVDAAVTPDVRRWLERDFFPLHLQSYSKSRRKAPIYWPLATASGGYTLWFYYPDLNNQTLFTAINDFIEPKLNHLSNEVAALRNKGSARSRDEEKAMEALQTLEKELVELHENLLQIAPTYRPNHDDGVQITAAPLWPLFRHKPWQKVLKETWEKLNKGDYDWSHLAMAYWPGRVREKCKTDKSLAIAHGLEELYEPPPESAAGPGRGGRKRRGTAI